MNETYISLRCGNQPPDTVEVDSENLLEGFYKALDCECIETVHLAGGYLMVIDESSKLEQKAFNPVASLLYNREPFDYIAGDALLARVGSRNGETDIVPLKDSETDMTLHSARIIWKRTQRRAGEEINKEKGEQANGNHSDGL